MIQTLQQVFEKALERLSAQIITYVPPLLVALAILVFAILSAHLARVIITRVFKGNAADRFLAESGFASVLPGGGPVHVAPLASAAVYWLILILGILTAVNVFDTSLTSQIVEATVFLFPKLIAAGAILLAGVWLAQYLGRSALIWACNEEIPRPRRIASGVRVAVVFIAVVVVADILNFAGRVFFAAFVIFAGGVVLTCSLALGLGARGAVYDWLVRRRDASAGDRSVFKHV